MDAGLGVDVLAAEFGQFTEAHTAPGGEQDHQPVALGDVVDDRGQLLERGGLGLADALGLAGAADPARVRRQQLVGDGGGADGLEQHVGVGAHRRGVERGPGVPLADDGGGEAPDRDVS